MEILYTDLKAKIGRFLI